MGIQDERDQFMGRGHSHTTIYDRLYQLSERVARGEVERENITVILDRHDDEIRGLHVWRDEATKLTDAAATKAATLKEVRTRTWFVLTTASVAVFSLLSAFGSLIAHFVTAHI